MKETLQEYANRALTIWQLQRLAGVEAPDRRLPSPANDPDGFEHDIRILRELMERCK